MKKRPKVGLAIGSGAAYGLSAIGVLKVLEEYEVPIDVISGTSIGSVIGALYASGMNSETLDFELSRTEWQELLDFVIPEKGIVSGKKIEAYIRKLTKGKSFGELKIPLYITAVDINKGQLVIFNKGEVASAVRASISIPGVFTPVEMGGRTLVDGAVLDPLPTDLLRKHADIIIAIDYGRELKPSSYASAKQERSEFFKKLKQDFLKSELNYLEQYLKQRKIRIPFPFRWFLSPHHIYNMIKKREIHTSSIKILEIAKKAHNIMANEMAKLKLQINKPDVLIKPDLSKMHGFDFGKSDYALKQGELATREKMKDIKKILKKN